MARGYVDDSFLASLSSVVRVEVCGRDMRTIVVN